MTVMLQILNANLKNTCLKEQQLYHLIPSVIPNCVFWDINTISCPMKKELFGPSSLANVTNFIPSYPLPQETQNMWQ